jgi:hypothetical protein
VPTGLADRPEVTLRDRCGLTWTAPTFDGGDTILDYRVWYDSGRGDSVFEILEENVVELIYTALNLNQGTVYSFRVQARNSYGYSGFSNIVSILAAQEPDVPASPFTTFNFDHVTIDWYAPDNAGSIITHYTILIRQGD